MWLADLCDSTDSIRSNRPYGVIDFTTRYYFHTSNCATRHSLHRSVVGSAANRGVFRTRPMSWSLSPTKSPYGLVTRDLSSTFTKHTSSSFLLLPFSPSHFIQRLSPCSSTDSPQDDDPHEHSQILRLCPARDVVLFARRPPFPRSDSPLLVSRFDVLLLPVAVCFLWRHCEHSPENCGTTDSCTVGDWSVICTVKFVDRMGMGHSGRGNIGSE